MSHIRRNIAIGLTLAALLVPTSVFAQGDDISPLKGRIGIADEDDAESIKLRSGPGNPVAGNEKSQLCQGCHGEFGDSTEPLIPKLGGQYGPYISKQIHDYQAGIRSHQIMNAMVGTLITENDVADVAAYFASQKKMKGDSSTENQLGKSLYLNGELSKMRLACVNCHGLRGKGLDSKISMYPVLGGQQKDYLRKQLIDFKEGDRTNSPNAIMNRITELLTDLEIESLAEYLSVQ